MPINSNDGLHDRMATLEAKIDNHSESIQRIELAVENLRKLIWRLGGGLAMLILVPVGPFYFYVLPHRIETVVSSSVPLNTKIVATIDEKLTPTKDGLSAFQDDMKAVKERLNAVIGVIQPLVTRRNIVQTLTKDTSGDRASLIETLPQARTLLAVVKRMKVPLQRQDYKNLSTRLSQHYSSATEPLKGELRSTMVEAANARSVTEAKHSSEAQAGRIEKAKETGNYFEGAIDLSTRETWKDAVFENCVITVGNQSSSTFLVDVLFINCSFQSGSENAATQELLTAFLESPQSSVTVSLGEKGEVSSYSLSKPKQKAPDAKLTH